MDVNPNTLSLNIYSYTHFKITCTNNYIYIIRCKPTSVSSVREPAAFNQPQTYEKNKYFKKFFNNQ